MVQYYRQSVRGTKQGTRLNSDEINDVRREEIMHDTNRHISDKGSEKYEKLEKPEKSEKVKDLIKGFLGRNVSVTLRGRKSLRGILETVSNYEILITVDHSPVIIMKHAIDYIELIAE